MPIVDGIDWNTIAHQDIYGGALNRGIWEWGFLYKESEVPERERAKHNRFSEPYWYNLILFTKLLLCVYVNCI